MRFRQNVHQTSTPWYRHRFDNVSFNDINKQQTRVLQTTHKAHYLSTKDTKMSNQKNELVRVELRVHKSLLEYSRRASDYFVAVTGPGLQLGHEDINKAPRCKDVRNNIWIKEIWLPKDSNIYFKFLVVKASNNVTVDVEEVEPRCLFIGQSAVVVNTRYNQHGFVVKEEGPQLPKPNRNEDNKRLRTKNLECENFKMETVENENVKKIKRLEEGSQKMNVLEEGSQKMKELEEGSQKMKELEEGSQKMKELEKECLSLKMLENKSINETKLPEELIKMEKINDNAEFTTYHHSSSNIEYNADRVTACTSFSLKGKKFFLLAAGVAAVSCVGYFVFR